MTGLNSDRSLDASTLIKLTHKYGEATVNALNDALMLKLKEEKMVRGRKLRMDTCVIEADIHYPADTLLLAGGIRVITRAVAQVKKAGLAQRARFVNHRRKVKRILCGISRVVKEQVSVGSPRLVKAQSELLELVREVMARGEEVRIQAEVETSRIAGKRTRAVSSARQWLERIGKVIRQTEAVLRGQTYLPQRLVNLFDPDARPIVRGKARTPVEFGRKVLLGETDKGIITTYQVVEDNPPDNTLIRLGVKGHRRLFRKRLRAVTADQGFHSRENGEWLEQQVVKRIALPFRGADKEQREYERQPWFRRLLRFRAGLEVRISHLKRVFGLDKCMMRGNPGINIWVGQGIFAYNLWQAVRMR